MNLPESAPRAPAPILERLAARVRARRKDLSLTLRELGESAGLSERFLVSLESGRANVSVIRLDDLARALGTTAAELIAAPAEARPSSAASKREAGRASGRGALVALLGLRGAGKTAIGERAARRLGVPFIELDDLVTERAGMSLGEIFELHGGAYYRKLSCEELTRLCASGARGILATGGSLVTDHQSYELLRGAALTIWLKAKPQDHWARVVAQGDARPMANRSGAMNELRALLRARRALYEQAAHVIDTSALGLERSVDRVVKLSREAARRPSVPG
jgi:XRE family aerobic/anaerobic benzoate catabolism transcriptional regulator